MSSLTSKTFALRLAAASAFACVALAPALAPVAAYADASEPAAQQIDSFDSALIRTMKTSGGPEARAKTITPAVEATFDFPTMLGFAVGPSWATASADDKAALTAAFRKFTVASYAKNFSGYSGQKITVDPNVLTRLPDKLVKTTLSDGSSNVVLAYRMRQSGGIWKVIDVLYNGSISQLTTQRSDFSATVASGGIKALIAKLDGQTQKLMAG
ncbi:MAG TPA: ABC transporter substrate-binding protein [Caulobacteraceae bacterium]|nr:ABC transporter substrate-binding protein [Caulobacteraceae bacterium]